MARLYVVVGLLVALSAVLTFAPGVEAQDARPQVQLYADDRIVGVGQEFTVTWSVSGAVSVSVRRDGSQVSTDHSGEYTEIAASKGVVEWELTASNPQGSTTEDLEIDIVTFGDTEDFVTGGPGGEWLIQMILAVVPGMVIIGASIWFTRSLTPGPFIAAGIITPVAAFVSAAMGLGNYWLATASLILLVLSILAWVNLERG